MIPYRDENPTVRVPVVTIGIIALNVVVWLFIQRAGTSPGLPRSICELGLIPGDLMRRLPAGYEIPVGRGLYCVVGSSPAWLTAFTYMFTHGGWFHILGNMWFLWIFGNNIEDAMGRWYFAVFYVLCGLLAAGVQILSSPGSPVPIVGASGAISGVMGAYLILYPRVRVHTLIFLGFFITTVSVPAYVMLLYWVVLQLVGSLPAVGQMGGGVAFFAHLGGFASGMLLILPFARKRRVAYRLY